MTLIFFVHITFISTIFAKTATIVAIYVQGQFYEQLLYWSFVNRGNSTCGYSYLLCELNKINNSLPSILDTWIGLPFKNAPLPFLAVNSCSRMGLYTIPRTISFLIAKPITTHICGNPWMKFMVPSMGSMIHVGLSVNSGNSLPVDSSAINLMRKNYRVNCSTNKHFCEKGYLLVTWERALEFAYNNVLDLTVVLGN